jgi:hypothetical protein
VVAQEARERTLEKMRQALIHETDALRADREKAVAALEERLAAVGRERDAAAGQAVDLGDRLRGFEATLVDREAALAKAEKEIRRLREPTEVERAQLLLASEDARVRAVGVARLADLREKPGAPAAFRQALLGSRSVGEALEVLRASGDADDLARRAVGADRVEVRRAVARVIEDRDALLRMLGDEDALVRAAAVARIGGLGIEGAAPALRKSAGDADVTVRSAAALALAQLGDWEAVTPLLADRDVRVARCALSGFVAAGKALPEGVAVHPDLASAVALGRRLLSERPDSD